MTLPQGQGLGCPARLNGPPLQRCAIVRATLINVKAVRIWFLLLLAVLLPVRGAVAAAMLCPVGSTGIQNELRVHGHPMGHEAMDHSMSQRHAAPHDHASAGHSDDGHDHAASDKCNACSAYCSLTPLLSSDSTFLEPPDLAAVKFADQSAPPPSFVSDGQERPPRTI